MDIAEPFIDFSNNSLILVIVKDFYKLEEIKKYVKGNIKTVNKLTKGMVQLEG